MQIEQWMKTEVISIPDTDTVVQAAKVMVWNQIGTLPVVDQHQHLMGRLTITDILELFMPDFVSLLTDIDFVSDFGAVETMSPDHEALEQPVTAVMHEPLSVERQASLMRTSAMLQKHNVHDVCVTDEEGRLVGIASRVDVGTALLAEWLTRQEEAAHRFKPRDPRGR